MNVNDEQAEIDSVQSFSHLLSVLLIQQDYIDKCLNENRNSVSQDILQDNNQKIRLLSNKFKQLIHSQYQDSEDFQH